MKKLSFKHTIAACSVGYVVQSVVNTFVPLLFLTFSVQYGIPLEKISILILFNFVTQLLTDIASAFFVDKIGYRASISIAHFLDFLGLVTLTVLPEIIDPFIGLIVSVFLYAVGGGLIEVLISPTIEACPTDNKAGFMSLLHSFYCWGCAFVIAVSTLFFFLFGMENWKILTVIWSVLPLANMIYFNFVPINSVNPTEEQGLSLLGVIKHEKFLLLFVLMVMAGACELTISQWASAFAELALNVNKSIGDMAGAFSFAILMGTARIIYSKLSNKINLWYAMFFSGILCLIGYLMTAIPTNSYVNLLGIGICGFSVGVLWPGMYSLSAKTIKNGGTKLFSLLAFAGDLGCSSGPAILGFISAAYGDNLKFGVLFCTMFPLVLVICLILQAISVKRENKAL